MIQERLDEFVFHRTYLRDQPMNVFIMLKILAKYGERALAFYEEDKNRDPWEKSVSRIKENWYRCPDVNTDIKEQEEENEEYTWELDENNNLVMYNEYGDIEDIYYANEAQAAEQPYERIQLRPQEEMEVIAAEAELNRMNIDEIDPNFSLLPHNAN